MPAWTDQRGVERATGLVDGVLVAALVALAWWTAVFHVALPARWPRDVAGAVWVLGLVAIAAGLWWRRRAATLTPAPPEREQPVRPRVPHAWVLVAAGGLVALLSATRWADTRPAWWLVWALVVLTCAAALVLVGRAVPVTTPATPTPAAGRHPSAGAVALVLALAVAVAAGSAVTMRADADDVFLVNRSTHVEQHSGPLPERDTIFGDEVFAAPRPDNVPTSVESLVGVVAAWSPVTAPTVTYLLLGPAASALAVLALWRLLRTLGAAAPAAATTAAIGFLLLDGAEHASFGNLHLTRAWQGKVVFLIVVVPLLWHHALRWARDGSRRDLLLLVVGHAAAIGLTSTAAFVAPAVTVVAAGAGAWASGTWRRLGWAVLATLPALLAVAAVTLLPRQDPAPQLAGVAPEAGLAPEFGLAGVPAVGVGRGMPEVGVAGLPAAEVAAGVLDPTVQAAGAPGPMSVLAVGPMASVAPADTGATVDLVGGSGPAILPSWLSLTHGADPAAEWHRVFGGGVGLAVPVAAVLAAWALVRDRASRAALALAPLVLFGGFYAPGVLELVGDVTGVRAVLWRVAWVLPVPAAVGLLVTAPALLGRSALRQAAVVALPLGLAGVLVAGSTTALDPANKVRIGWPALDLNPEARVAAQVLIDLSDPGDVVLSPVPVGGVLATLTTEVRPVNPRASYMRGRHAVPELRGPQRLLASEAVTTGAEPAQQAEVTEALVALEVATACVAAGLGNPVVDAALEAAGLVPVAEDAHCTYWRRAP